MSGFSDRPVPFTRGLAPVVRLTLRTSLGPRRLVAAGLLLAAPLLFAVLALLAREPPGPSSRAALYGSIVVSYYVANVLPLAALFIASALVADELEGRTLGYLLSRPITRSTLLLGRLAASLFMAALLTALALALTYALLANPATFFGHLAALGRDLGVALLALVTYACGFTLLGTLVRRPLIPGLLFTFGWEKLANVPGLLPRLTINAHLRALLSHAAATEGVMGATLRPIPAGQALVILLGITCVSTVAALWVFAGREYTQEEA